MQEMYLRFVDAIEKGNQLEYRFTGHMILEKYPSSELAGLVRWWVAYRLYMDLEYRLARETLKPNLAVANTYLPHSKLLDARLSFAMAENSFKQKYEDLKAQHPGTQAAKPAAVDLKTIEGEYTR
jgi:TolA-binding protein